MGLISKRLKQVLIADHFATSQRNFTAVVDVIMAVTILSWIILGLIYIVSSKNDDISFIGTVIRWSALGVFMLYLIRVIWDIRKFPLKQIWHKLVNKIRYIEHLDNFLSKIILNDTSTKISYVIEYLPDNCSYYPIFIVNNKKYVNVSTTNYTGTKYGALGGGYHIMGCNTEKQAIDYAKTLFEDANRIAMNIIDTNKQIMISKKNKQTETLNIKIDLKSRYSKPISLN